MMPAIKKQVALFRGLLQALLVVLLCVLLAPWLLTHQDYRTGHTAIAPHFPIAIQSPRGVRVITWQTYQQTPDRYRQSLLTQGSPHTWPLESGNAVRLEPQPDGSMALTYYTDHYVFWASYLIDKGKVYPLTLRYSGAFIIFPLLLLAVLGIVVWRIAMKGLRIIRARHQHTSP